MTELGPRLGTVARYAVLAVLAALAAVAGSPGSARAQDSAVNDPPAGAEIARHLQKGLPELLEASATSSGAVTPTGRGPMRALEDLWAGTDAVALIALLALAFMLAGAGTVVLRKSRQLAMLARHARTVEQRFWTAPNVYEAVRSLEGHSEFRSIAEQGLEAATHREGKLTDRIDAREWIAMSLQRSVAALHAKLQHGLALLDTIGTTAPLIGLLGTVWAMQRALATFPYDAVAAPFAAALPVTAVGLAVAVLAIAGSSWLERRNKLALATAREFAEQFQAILLCADNVTSPPRRDGAGRG